MNSTQYNLIIYRTDFQSYFFRILSARDFEPSLPEVKANVMEELSPSDIYGQKHLEADLATVEHGIREVCARSRALTTMEVDRRLSRSKKRRTQRYGRNGLTTTAQAATTQASAAPLADMIKVEKASDVLLTGWWSSHSHRYLLMNYRSSCDCTCCRWDILRGPSIKNLREFRVHCWKSLFRYRYDSYPVRYH